MRSMAIIGAGQMGKTISELINLNQVKFIGFGDNDSRKWTKNVREGDRENILYDSRCPVMPVEKAVAENPDSMIIGVVGKSRPESLARQVRDLGYKGTIHFADDLHEDFDLRGRCISQIIRRIQENGVKGAAAELGVYKGDTAWRINALMPERKMYLFDTFEGFDDRDVEKEKSGSFSKAARGDFSDTSVEAVMKRFVFPERIIVRKGFFPETTRGLENERYSFVSMDPDLYGPVLAGLDYFYPRLNPGGCIVLHDYNNEQFMGVKKAVEDYEKIHGRLNIVPLGDFHGSCVIMKG